MTERLAIQGFFDDGGDEAGLLSHFGIKARFHPRFPNLVQLKYDQIASPNGEPIVRECRGIIIDRADSNRVVCWSFGRFFNHGEGHAAPIDWPSAEVLEKIDGSLMQLYPYKGEWHVASSGTPDAGGEVNGFGFTFAELFWKTMGKDRAENLPYPSGHCFAFELTAPENRVVVRHPTPKLTLLGGRYLGDLREMHRNDAAVLLRGQFDVVKAFDLKDSFSNLEASFATMSPVEQEGYVVVDAKFNRVKVKHPGYVALHHSLGGMSPRALLEIARQGEVSEVLAAFPEFTEQVEECKKRLDDLHLELDHTYQQIKHLESQKEFALVACKTRLSSALFTLRLGRTESLRHYFREMRIDALASVLGYSTDAKLERPLLDMAPE